VSSSTVDVETTVRDTLTGGPGRSDRPGGHGPAGTAGLLRPEPDDTVLPRIRDLADVLAVLDLAGDVTPPVPVRVLPSAHGGVLGAQQLAQQIVLAERLAPGKTVQTLHTVFPNPSRWDAPLEVDVECSRATRTRTCR
jgi:acyl-CoA thioesterase-2